MNKHIFIIADNKSGSTVVFSMLNNCQNVLPLRRPPKGKPIEGHGLVYRVDPKAYPNDYRAPEHEYVWWDMPSLKDDSQFNWPRIKEIWTDGWKRNATWGKYDPQFLLEKSPQNVVVAGKLAEQFDNAHFIVLVRNPYAAIEGIKNSCPQHSYKRIAKHWVECARRQWTINRTCLPNVTWMRYEDLAAYPLAICARLNMCIPGLLGLSPDNKITCHVRGRSHTQPLRDYNAGQIANLSQENIDEINAVLCHYADLMKELEYEFI
jgi:hypothetical protein